MLEKKNFIQEGVTMDARANVQGILEYEEVTYSFTMYPKSSRFKCECVKNNTTNTTLYKVPAGEKNQECE